MIKEIEFNRPAKYTLVEELGSGACGATVLLRDEGMGTDLVAKKYRPFFQEGEDDALYAELLNRFRDEARILFRLNHPNIVRVFNYYDYPEIKTAYIVMEYIEGSELLDFLNDNPFAAERVFEGIVDGFSHLQDEGVLHRDIRPANILVRPSGTPKIINFGFGKALEKEGVSDDPKSISLNWWCETPPDFVDGIYDFQTEVYFVGKLFEKALSDGGLTEFKYKLLVGRMCEPDRQLRIDSFQQIQTQISLGKFDELAFSEPEISTYREFAGQLSGVVSSVQSDARFERDAKKILPKLEELHRRTMLEEFLPAPNKLAGVFIHGAFSYWKNSEIQVSTIQRFITLLRGLTEEKKGIVIENLTARLDASERTDPPYLGDEIPF
tara:strand:- start:97 stop:1239 length:1143 start_codon:yes stop_codon:yes gene_type:complete